MRKPNTPWWRSPAWWVTTTIASVALVLSAINTYWAHFRVAERLRLTPIQLRQEFSSGDALTVEFALANTGTSPAILAELCLLPRPWDDTVIDVNNLTPGERIPSVTGISWRAEPNGAVHAAIPVDAGDVLSVRAYFDLSAASDWVAMGNRDEVELEMYACQAQDLWSTHAVRDFGC